MIESTAFPELFLVPINFSTASLNAGYTALELAAKMKARVKLIHSYTLPDVRPMSFDDTEMYASTLSAQLTDIKEEAEKNMASFLDKITTYASRKKLSDIPISSKLINGVPGEIAMFTAESEKAGLIIIGVSSKEERSFEPMGKIASRIVDKSSIPVLIIPEETDFKGVDKLKNVLYLTSFDESDFPAIGKLLSFIKWLDTNIFCLHIGREEKDQWDKIKMEGLREYFNKAYGKPNVKTDLIFSKDMIQSLDYFISSNHIDLIGITAHKRNIISKLINPDITLKILYHTRIPLLVFHG
jgi:Universal stress protein UspA and related nucleotide-binding proteins